MALSMCSKQSNRCAQRPRVDREATLDRAAVAAAVRSSGKVDPSAPMQSLTHMSNQERKNSLVRISGSKSGAGVRVAPFDLRPCLTAAAKRLLRALGRFAFIGN